jgi:hypothetical protein
MRSTKDVLEDHLQRALVRDIDTDISRNFAEDCVILTCFGNFHGRDGVRRAAELLEAQLPNARYHYNTTICNGELALLEWTAEADGARVDDGADSFLIQDGAIRVMTVHCTPRAVPDG